MPQRAQSLNGAGGLAAFGSLNGFFTQYFAFLQGGGNPDNFGGLPIFVDYLAAIEAFYAFLAGGGLPSAYTVLTPEQIEAYLAALDAAGLLSASFSGDVLAFYTSYLAFLAGGGVPDDFAGLPGGLDTTFTGIYRALLQPGVSSFGPFGAATVTADGQITTTTNGGVVTNHAATAGTLREHGRFGNDVAFTRYENPAVSGQATNQNTHLLVGNPATNLPASGTVEYALVGGTLPTDVFVAQGTTGSFSGRMAVAFKPVPEVGLDFDVYFGGRGWNTRTAGGADVALQRCGIAIVLEKGLRHRIDGEAVFGGVESAVKLDNVKQLLGSGGRTVAGLAFKRCDQHHEQTVRADATVENTDKTTHA